MSKRWPRAASLVARKDLSVDLVERLLGVIYESTFARYDEPSLEIEALTTTPELPWHEGSVRYRNRNRPLIGEDLLDHLEKELSIAAAVLGGAFFVWQLLQSKIRKLSTEGFEDYIVRVLAIERRAMVLEASPEMNLATLLKLQRDLARLKTERSTGLPQEN